MIIFNYRTIVLLAICATPFHATAQTGSAEIKKYIEEAKKADDDDGYMAVLKSADSFARKTNDIEGQAVIAREIGNHYYNTDADECIKYLTKAMRLYQTAGNKNDATFCLSNIAFAYEEKKKDIPEAMKFTKRAITSRTEMKDTLNMANMYKYQAMLFGKLHDFDNGKKSAAKAIQLYSAKNNQLGIAVSYRDLGTVYEQEREYDSSIELILKAREIWKHTDKPDEFAYRVYGNNTDLIRIYTKAGKMTEAEDLVHENEAAKADNFNYEFVLSFYKESGEFYSKNKDKDNARLYHEKYSSLRKSLKEEGKNVE